MGHGLENGQAVVAAGGLAVAAARQGCGIQTIVVLRDDLLLQRCRVSMEVRSLHRTQTRGPLIVYYNNPAVLEMTHSDAHAGRNASDVHQCSN